MIDFTKPVQTRNGEKVRIVSTDGHPEFPIVGYIEYGDFPAVWNPDGKFCNGAHESGIDLIQSPAKRTLDVWVNVYEDGSVGAGRNSKLEADERRISKRIACLHIVREYTEGEGL